MRRHSPTESGEPDRQHLQPSVHPVYLKLLCAQLKQRGIEPQGLLQHARLTAAETRTSEGAFLPFERVRHFIQLALDEAQCPWLGLEGPGVARMSAHGVVGFAIASSPSIEEALQHVVRYAPLRGRFLHFELQQDDDGVTLQALESFDYGEAREYLVATILAGVVELLETLGVERASLELFFPFEEPEWINRYQQRFDGMRLAFESAKAGVRMPHAIQRQAPLTQDAEAYLGALRDCERLLQREAEQQKKSLRDRLQHELMACQGHYPNLQEMADRLNLSTRTVMRRLAAEGSSYQAVLDEVRQDLACWYLVNTRQPVEWIAQRVGYEDPSNFSRTFRRWSGMTPGAYRRYSTGRSS